MLPGFNHNIRHKGVLFHIQTEDSGIQNPIVVTHVFVGGNVIASRRRTYEKFAKAEDLKSIISGMMKDQHKEIMKDLVHGRIKAAEDMIAHSGVVTPAPVPAPSTEPTTPQIPPLGKRPPVPPARVAPRPYRRPTAVSESGPTLDTSVTDEKSLDELILDFLNTGQKKKP